MNVTRVSSVNVRKRPFWALFGILLAIVSTQAASTTFLNHLKESKFPMAPWEEIEMLISTGSMRGFFTLTEMQEILDYLAEKFPNIVSKRTAIGKSFNKLDMDAYVLSTNVSEVISSNSASNKPILFMNGLHHARETTSLSFLIYITLKWITMCSQGDHQMVKLFNETAVWVLPIVNVDGYTRMCEIWNTRATLGMIRKNRHDHTSGMCRMDEDMGVDLNRNYDFKFALDEEGSSGDKCDETYRGPSAFSEPETQAVRDFCINNPNIKVALNFHGWGNLWITPFSYEKTVDNSYFNTNYSAAKIYDEVKKEGNLSSTAIFGNAMQAIQYFANGETSDWMYGERKIIAFSPELGSDDKRSETFHPEREVILGIMQTAAPTVEYVYSKILPDVQVDYDMWSNSTASFELEDATRSQYTKTFTLQVFNRGLSGLKSDGVRINITGVNNGSFILFADVIHENSYFPNAWTPQGFDLAGTVGKFHTKPQNNTNATRVNISDVQNGTARATHDINIEAREFLKLYVLLDNTTAQSNFTMSLSLTSPKGSEHETFLGTYNHTTGKEGRVEQPHDQQEPKREPIPIDQTDKPSDKEGEGDQNPSPGGANEDLDYNQFTEGGDDDDDSDIQSLWVVALIAVIGLAFLGIWLYKRYVKQKALLTLPAAVVYDFTPQVEEANQEP